jgi:hypothetical protein
MSDLEWVLKRLDTILTSGKESAEKLAFINLLVEDCKEDIGLK